MPSRRLGQSLGVNPVPCKTCTYSCVYCQLGHTTNVTTERRRYRDTDSVTSAVLQRLEGAALHPDFVTFLGCGEPTLASNMEDILNGISAATSCKTALLTNGALLWDPEVRKEALGFDVVLPTIAAGSEDLFRRMHRPHPSLNLKKVLSGMRRFSDDFAGELWVEVMLVNGLNDDEDSLEEIRAAVDPLHAHRIDLTAPVRPPAESWVRCPTREGIERALRAIAGAVDTTEQETGQFDVRRRAVVKDILEIARIHPMREDQMLETLVKAGMSREESLETIKRMLDTVEIVGIEHRGKTYYRARR